MALRTDSDPDSKLNPGQSDYDRKFSDIAKAEEGGTFDDIAKNYDKTADASQENANIEAAREKEATGSWANNVSSSPKQTKASGRFNFLKKKGAIATIIALLGIGGIGFSGLFSGAGLLINMKEQLAANLMDSVPTIFNARSSQLLQHKLSNLTTGLCTGVTIRCKFSTMSDRQIRNLERAGFTVNTDGTNILGNRSKVTSLSFDGQEINASNVRQLARTNPKIASAFNKAFNPRLHAWSSAAAEKWYGRVGASKGKNLSSSPDIEDMKDSLRDTLAGRTPAALQAEGLVRAGETPDGAPLYQDANGEILDQEQVNDRLAARNADLQRIANAKKSLLDTTDPSRLVGSAVKSSLLIGVGALDSVCTGWSIIRAAGFAAKYLGQVQMIRYANVFLTTADSIKAGEATQEETGFLGDIITSKNRAGVSGTNSRGWNYAAYGDVTPVPEYGAGATTEISNGVSNLTDDSVIAEILKSEVTNYISGQITSDSVMATLTEMAGQGGASTDAMDNTCGFVKSGWGQGIILGVGGALLVGCIAVNIIPALGQVISGGCFTASTVISAGISVTIAVTVSLLTPYLISLASDTLITGDENGNQAVNAVVSGAGAMNSQVGLASGAGYLSTADANEFNASRDESRDYFAAIDTNDYSPLDAGSGNTFLGKMVSYLAPYVSQSTSMASGFTSALSLVTSSLGALLPSSRASAYGDAGVCPDTDYKEAGIATDINCNPIVGQSESTLNMDVSAVLDYMIGGGHISEVSGMALSPEFRNYTTYCLERATAFGDRGEGNEDIDYKTGAACKEGYSEATNVFRAYQSLLLTNQGMDEEEPSDTGTASGSVVAPVDPGYSPPAAGQDFGPRSCDGCSTWHKGVDLSGFPGGSLGKPVYSIADGEVIMSGIGGAGSDTSQCAGRGTGSNNTVAIRHANGVISQYLHMGGQSITVNVGDRVTAGQRIGSVNNCGQSYGAHLHFEVRVNETSDPIISGLDRDPSGSFVNPVQYMALYGVTL